MQLKDSKIQELKTNLKFLEKKIETGNDLAKINE